MSDKLICPGCKGPKTARAPICILCSREKRRREARERPKPSLADTDDTGQVVLALKSEVSKLKRRIKEQHQQAAVEAAVIQAVKKGLETNPYRPQFNEAKKPTDGKCEMLLLVSDAHYPEVVSPDECYGVEYGPEVCRRRMGQIRDAVFSYLAARPYNVCRLTIGVLGDMLSGDIHEELSITNASPMAQALVEMSHLLTTLGASLGGAVPVHMVVMPGNHPRMTRKPHFKQKWNNYEWLMGHMIQAQAGDSFTVEVPTELVHIVDIHGRKIGLTHGDGVKAQSFAGIPHYSLQRRRNALQQLLREVGEPQLDLLCYGHFHQLIYDDQAGFLINGSIKGTDEFGAATRYAYARPCQSLVTFHEQHFITDISRIVLQ